MPYKLFLILSLFICKANAQTAAVQLIVQDADSGDPLPYASIVQMHDGKGFVTDLNGKLSLSIAAEKIQTQLIVSRTGYQTDTVMVTGRTFTILLRHLSVSLDEMVFTGVAKATRIRENPVAINNVSTKNINRSIESNLVDVLVKHVPGLNAVKTGPNISKPFIRGLGYNRVLTLYDGLRQEGQQWGDEHGLEVDAYNMEKAEVIKGPASLMFGSDAVAGVVSLFPYVPKESDDKWQARFISEYQSNNGLWGNALRIGYHKNHWLAAISGSYRMAKNYTNKMDGRVYNTGFDEKNLSGLIGYHSTKGYTNLNMTLYDNLQGIPDGSRDSLSRKFTKQVKEGAEDDITKRPIVSDDELNSYHLSPLHQHIQHYRIYVNNQYHIGSGEISANIGFQQNIRREYNHPSMPQQAGLFVRLNTVNYGLKYNVSVLPNTEISAGFNGMYQNNKSRAATDFPIPDYNLFDIGGFVYTKWKHDKLAISGGVRYDMRSLQGNDFYIQQNAATGFNEQAFGADTANATLQFSVLQKRFTGISLSIGAAYQLDEHISLKANIGRGYRAPNITEIASNGLDPGAHIVYLGNRSFVPEFSFQQDLGLSAEYANISASASFFNNYIQNYIYLTQLVDVSGNAITDAQGNKTFQYLQGKAQLYGLEATADLHPVAIRGFHFTNALSLVYGYNRGASYKNKSTQGEYLPLIPPMRLLSIVSQEIVFADKKWPVIQVSVEADYNAGQHRYLGLSSTETSTPAYTLVNVAAGTQFTKWKHPVQLQLQAANLFNTAYQSHLSRLKYFEYYNGKGMYNMGRNLSLKVIVAM